MSSPVTLTFTCDVAPLALFMKLFKAALAGRDEFLDVTAIDFDVARVEHEYDRSPASSRELVLRLYPSNTLLRYAANCFDKDCEFASFQKVYSNFPPYPNSTPTEPT